MVQQLRNEDRRTESTNLAVVSSGFSFSKMAQIEPRAIQAASLNHGTSGQGQETLLEYATLKVEGKEAAVWSFERLFFEKRENIGSRPSFSSRDPLE